LGCWSRDKQKKREERKQWKRGNIRGRNRKPKRKKLCKKTCHHLGTSAQAPTGKKKPRIFRENLSIKHFRPWKEE